jgi:hypothetical protein
MFKSNLLSFALKNTGDREGPITSVSVERCGGSIWDTTDIDTDYIVDVRSHNDNQIADDKHFLDLDDRELKSDVEMIFRRLDERVELDTTNIEIESPSIKLSVRELSTELNEDSFNSECEIDSNLVAMRMVDKSRERYSSEVMDILDTVSEEIDNEIGDSCSINDYREVSILFSDFMQCELSGVRLDIATESPHLYYEGVSSVEGYVDKSKEPEKLSDGRYKVFFRLDYKNGEIDKEYIPDKIQDKSEEEMRHRMCKYASVEGNHSFEAESIILEDEIETTSFFIRQDVNEVLKDI